MEGFPKIDVSFLGVAVVRTIEFWRLHRRPSIYGNYHIYI